MTGMEVHAQKIDFLRLFGKKVVSDVSRWAWHRRNRVINREKPIVLKLALYDGKMRLTGTFLDEISFDIPHQNWGPEEWDKDFAAMKALGIKRVIMIRAAAHNCMAYPSKVIPKYGMFHMPSLDLVDTNPQVCNV